jgi:NAD(P)-dependent dehydrogenase (short-subunit alcohol dehydrogenase family)
MKDFRGRVAVVTGGASGIGRGLADLCAAEGMKVVLADIEEPALKDAEQSLKNSGADVLAVPTDVSKLGDVEALAQKTIDAFGAVHLLFNNAGVAEVQHSTDLWEHTINDWLWVSGINLWGLIHGIKTFVPIMLRQNDDCHIINTSSIGGLMHGPAIGIYGMTKAAIVSISETLYAQLRQRNARIGVSVLCPAGVRTRIVEADRNRPPELRDPPRPDTPEQLAVLRFFQELNEAGMPPEKFAGLVFEAIRQDRLYVLTHPESIEGVRERMENILAGRNPAGPEQT